MLGLRFSAPAKVASVAFAAFMLSAVPSIAAQHQQQKHHVDSGATIYQDRDAYYDQGNEAVFPNTEDHSTECVNGYRWQRHNHDWFKTTGQDELPLPCR